jgi:hypothetical protein
MLRATRGARRARLSPFPPPSNHPSLALAVRRPVHPGSCVIVVCVLLLCVWVVGGGGGARGACRQAKRQQCVPGGLHPDCERAPRGPGGHHRASSAPAGRATGAPLCCSAAWLPFPCWQRDVPSPVQPGSVNPSFLGPHCCCAAVGARGALVGARACCCRACSPNSWPCTA